MASYEMIDVLTRLRELDKKNPNVISDAVSNTERMNGEQVDEAKKSAAQKKAQEKFKAMVKGKTADDKDSMDEAHKGAKPDFLDMDKDGDTKEPMKKAIKDKKTAVKEGAEESAQLVMASKDMVDKVTGWMENTASMQTETMLELADAVEMKWAWKNQNSL